MKSYLPSFQAQLMSLGHSQPDFPGDAESTSAISSHTLSSQSTTVPNIQPKSPTIITSTASAATPQVTLSGPENPWLVIQSSSSKIAKKKNEIVVGKSSGPAQKSKNRLRKHQGKHESEREKARDEAVVEISLNGVLNLRSEDEGQEDPTPAYKGKDRAEVETLVNGDPGEGSDVNSEVEEQERRLAEKRGKRGGKARDQGAVKPFAQRDLVSLAFAGDKVVQVCPFPKYSLKAITLHPYFVYRTSKRLNKGRYLRMHPSKWTQPCLDGCAPLPAFLELSTPLLSNYSRVHGVGLVRKKRHQNRSLPRRSLGSIPVLDRTTGKRTSLSLRNETRRLPSTWSRTFHTPTQARRSMRGAYGHRSGRNGILGLGSREGHCRG